MATPATSSTRTVTSGRWRSTRTCRPSGRPARSRPIEALLRFHGAVARDAAVEAWLASRPPALQALARTWIDTLRGCGPQVRELMHDGCATACIGDAPFAYVGVYTAHVNVGFFHGAALADPHRLLQGRGKRMRHVKLRPGDAVDADALRALVDAAFLDLRARLGHG